MRQYIVILAASSFAALSAPARADTDPRVTYLEQEVRELRRQVLVLTQRLDQATTRPVRQAASAGSRNARPASDASASWVNADKWKSLRRGMSELEVIQALGAPTSVREEGDTRVIFYALEIGQSGFLGGNVRFREGAAFEINQPSLSGGAQP